MDKKLIKQISYYRILFFIFKKHPYNCVSIMMHENGITKASLNIGGPIYFFCAAWN